MPDGNPSNSLADFFETQRLRLHSIAYRILGSHADADDAIQEAWLRLARQDVTTIDNLTGWLTTVVGRICLDVLRSRQVHPEEFYDETRLPDVVAMDDSPTPDDDATSAESIGRALLVVLDSLQPSERLAFVLHDLFAVPFDEIGHILGRSTNASKMLASRARRKVRTSRRPAVAVQTERTIVRAFLAAARDGDFDGLLRVLDPDVRLSVDGADGAYVILGATKVAAGAQVGSAAARYVRMVLVDGLPGIVSWRDDGAPLAVLAFTVLGERIAAIESIVDPAVLTCLHLPDRDRRDESTD